MVNLGESAWILEKRIINRLLITINFPDKRRTASMRTLPRTQVLGKFSYRSVATASGVTPERTVAIVPLWPLEPDATELPYMSGWWPPALI